MMGPKRRKPFIVVHSKLGAKPQRPAPAREPRKPKPNARKPADFAAALTVELFGKAIRRR